MSKVWMNGTLHISVLKIRGMAVRLSANFLPAGADGVIPVGGAPEFDLPVGEDLVINGLMMEVNLPELPESDGAPVPRGLMTSSGRGDAKATMTVIKADGSEE